MYELMKKYLACLLLVLLIANVDSFGANASEKSQPIKIVVGGTYTISVDHQKQNVGIQFSIENLSSKRLLVNREGESVPGLTIEHVVGTRMAEGFVRGTPSLQMTSIGVNKWRNIQIWFHLESCSQIRKKSQPLFLFAGFRSATMKRRSIEINTAPDPSWQWTLSKELCSRKA